MIVILGAGISGMLAAQRLRAKKIPFLLLDRAGGLGQSHSNLGFFYAHRSSEFTQVDPVRIRIVSCSGGTASTYSQKVYGKQVPVSYARYNPSKDVDWVGWRYDPDKLTEGLRESFIPRADVYSISTQDHVIYLADGRSWRYDLLVSTIPFPVLLKLSHAGPHPDSLVFHHKPIYITAEPNADLHPTNDGLPTTMRHSVMVVQYCPVMGHHPWYRATTEFNAGMGQWATRYENTEPHELCTALQPGKIWLENDEEESSIARLRYWFCTVDIYLVGRYAKWIPKYLTNDSDHDIQELVRTL